MMSYLAGLGTGLSLILAIGAQNAFVLKQGLMRSHVFPVCLFCAVSDAALIAVGVGGMTMIGEGAPWLVETMRWGGVIFLFLYGLRSFRAALKGGEALKPEGRSNGLAVTLATIAALTWLNPHVYLDTVVLLGAVAAQWPDQLSFAIGAMSGSFMFFFGLGYGARLLAPVFAKPQAWQWLELSVGCIMWIIALKLAIG